MASSDELDTPQASGIAVVALNGRFPGARDLDAYWRNLRDGVESITFFSDEQLLAEGIPAEVLKQPSYVKARGVVEDIDLFDATFFGYSPKDALLMDPQQRLFLQCAWESLELAGYDPRSYRGLIGVYGGATSSSYRSLVYQGLPPAQLDGMAISIGNELSFLTTRVSYKLDLRGPSYPVQTACSTSLVAVHLACQGLLNAECDMAIAGGVSLRLPQANGLLVSGRRHPLAGRPLPSVRREVAGHAVQQRYRAGDPEAARRRDCRPRHDPCGDQGLGDQQRRVASRQLHRPRRRGQTNVDGGRPGERRSRSRDDQLRRGARHGDGAWRLDRGPGADEGVRRRIRQTPVLRAGLGEGQHRSPRRRRGRRRPDQDDSRDAAQAAAADAAFREGQSGHQVREHGLLRER